LSGAGTGKGLLAKACCVVASGVRPHAFTGGHDASELDKRLSAALVQGRSSVFLDNFNAKELTSDTLASALTENPAQVRVMGLTKMVPLFVCTFIAISGNGVEIAEDMARRLLNSRLDARMENPEERKFKPGFLDDVLTQRPDLLSNLLMIWRWWRQNGSTPDVGRALGNYEVWAQWVRDQLKALWLTASPPYLRLPSSIPGTTTLFPQIVSASFSVVLRYPPPQAPRASGNSPRPRV
jgi:hypothetical protein